MLSQLTVRNFAIVDQLQIDWHAGLNVITGETGAGKSILIDAVGALLGDRLGAEVVRGGASRALVEGVFTIPDEPTSQLRAVLDEFGFEAEDGALIVSREIAASGGRGSARVNGRAVPLSVLQTLGELLVDVHGQSEHMALLRAREQLEYLDQYAGALVERADVARLVRELRTTRDALKQLVAAEREAAREQDMLRHELSEIEAADLLDGEEDELLAQRARLQHVERLRQAAQTAHDALLGADNDVGDRPGAVELLGQAVAACQDGGRIDPALVTEGETLGSALSQAEDAARTLRDYLDGLEVDPQTLERTAERLFLIGDLKRKYGESVAEILSYASNAQQRLTEIERRADRRAELEKREQDLVTRLSSAAGILSRRRRAAADSLSRAIESELADLRLVDARFVVLVLAADEADSTGMDRVEFQIAAGTSDEPRPIARVASGGELARIALALKTVLSRAETRTTLIFDEVDAGVGGRTAPVVGEKLRAVASAGHQVLCVTHMPQVAAYADSHYVVAKVASATGTGATVTRLEPDERLEELAAMLAGTATAAARQSARELIERAGRQPAIQLAPSAPTARKNSPPRVRR